MGNLWADVARSTRPIWGNIIILFAWLASAALGMLLGMLLSDWPIVWMAGGFAGLSAGLLGVWLVYRLWPQPGLTLWLRLFPSRVKDIDDTHGSASHGTTWSPRSRWRSSNARWEAMTYEH